MNKLHQHGKRNFQSTPHPPFKLDSTETKFNKSKDSSPIICEFETAVRNKAV